MIGTMAHCTLLMGAMPQVVDHVEGYNMITPPHEVVCPNCPPSQEEKKKVKGKGSEVLDFWEKCIGKEVSEPNLFFVLISTYISFFRKVWFSERRLPLSTIVVVDGDNTRRVR
jgi:hypothetical protein